MVGQGSQKNKAHKAGRRAGRSAREKHRDKKDMVHRTGIKSSGNTARGKADRVNTAKQQRDRKRAELLEARRAAGPPILVALLPLSNDVDVQALWDGLLAACTDVPGPSEAGNADGGMEIDDIKAAGPSGSGAPAQLAPITLSLPERRKVKFTFLPPPADRSDPLAIVELGRAAEVLLCALPGEAHAVAIDDEGSVALGVLRAMGMPSTVALVQSGIDAAGQASLKERSAAKKRGAEAFTAHIPGDHRLLSADASADFKQILRHLADSPHPPPLWRRQRAQLVAQEATFVPDPSDPGKGRLVLTGYVRGQSLNAAQALHVPTAGDFQIEAIEGPPEPAAANEAPRPRAAGPLAMEAEGSGLGGAPVLARVDPDAREPLVRENEPDLLDAEQTWPTEAELAEADAQRAAKAARRKRLLPKGISDYQAAWIPDDGADWNDDADADGREDDDGSLPDLEPNVGAGGPVDMEPDTGDEPWNIADGGATEADMDYDLDGEGHEDAAAAKARARREAEADDAKFPDEVETPIDIPARRRFARYRGLKSFRTSPWDPKEDLPQDYARVFAFENWKRTTKRAREAAVRTPEPGAGVLAGTWVAVAAAEVPAEAALRVVERVRASQTGAAPVLTAWGLMQHECKLSVLNFGVKKATAYTDPIANKEELLFVTGLRSFPARPIFSTDEHGADKHKMERFLMEGRSAMATVFAPIAYPPLPLLAFKMDPSGRAVLAATGALRDCNPDRVVLKKIVLSGYPVKAHKSKAVVRWMFHTPEDVKWFRPVELWTKQGRRGRIREPLGTHGTMKTIFDGPVGQQDAVCMSLYKRAFPKWPQDLTFA